MQTTEVSAKAAPRSFKRTTVVKVYPDRTNRPQPGKRNTLPYFELNQHIAIAIIRVVDSKSFSVHAATESPQ